VGPESNQIKKTLVARKGELHLEPKEKEKDILTTFASCFTFTILVTAGGTCRTNTFGTAVIA
jgi:hypothetical protein